MHAGPEIGVASTKTFTPVGVLICWRCASAQLRGALARRRARRLIDELRALPQQLRPACRPSDGRGGRRAPSGQAVLLLPGAPVGLSGVPGGRAEAQGDQLHPAEAYAAGEMKHGPIALLDEQTPVVCVATASHVSDKLQSNLQEVRARGGQVIAIATAGDPVSPRWRTRSSRCRAPIRCCSRCSRSSRSSCWLPHRPRARRGCRPAAQPGQDRHGRVSLRRRPSGRAGPAQAGQAAQARRPGAARVVHRVCPGDDRRRPVGDGRLGCPDDRSGRPAKQHSTPAKAVAGLDCAATRGYYALTFDEGPVGRHDAEDRGGAAPGEGRGDVL